MIEILTFFLIGILAGSVSYLLFCQSDIHKQLIDLYDKTYKMYKEISKLKYEEEK